MARLALVLFVFAILTLLIPTVNADAPRGYVIGKIKGQEYYVRDNRQPSLYTGDYGDCLGGSSINVTRFDAAYYKDNMTILFHLGGVTALRNESIMSTASHRASCENQSNFLQCTLASMRMVRADLA